MRNRILSLIVGFIVITSFGANAVNKDSMKKDNYNGWFYDKDTEQDNYYIDGDILSNGWFQIKENWYYFKNDGAMSTGWLSLNNNWYYLNKSGAMKTGWLQDSVGKYYYLNVDGTMAHDTIIDGYQLGSDGAWIK